MRKVSRDEFKDAMRRAEIEKRIREADKKANRIEQEDKGMNTEEVEKEMGDIIGDSAAHFATDSQVDTDEPRKPGRPKKTKAQPVAPKKRGRKPKTETKDAPKEPVAAGQEDAKQEALKALVEIADRWVSGRKLDADRYKKMSEDTEAQAKQYQGYIDTVKEMIQ